MALSDNLCGFHPEPPQVSGTATSRPRDERRHPKHHLAWIFTHSEINSSADGAIVSSMLEYSLTAPVFAV
jgi:hypothetical protein